MLEKELSGKFQVGDWRVDPRLNALSLNGTSIRVEPKVMEVLVCLASHPGEPVTKEKILQSVWPDTFVSDDVLVRSISELRRVFEDDAKEPRFIQTIPKRGYRLVAPVVPVNGTPPETHELATAAANRFRPVQILGAVAAILFLVLVIRNGKDLRARFSGDGLPPIHSLAVLPLQNLSGDSGQEYFADAMTEELITELSRISALNVISRTSVMPYKDSKKSLPEIARELHADAIVEGSILRSGDRVRVTAQLIYAPKDTNVWAQTYDRDLEDVLTLQSAVATAIANEVRVKLTTEEQSRLTKARRLNLRAMEAYLQGNRQLEIADPLEWTNGKQKLYLEAMNAAQISFEEAIRIDREYAPAYVGLAKSVQWDPLSPDRIERARAALLQAIALDENLAEAHLELAELLYHRDWNWPAAEKELQRSIQLNASFAHAHAQYADYLDAMGRFDEGTREFQLVLALDPGHEWVPNTYYRRRQYDQAIELYQNDVKRGIFGLYAHWDLGHAYEAAGRHDEAVREFSEMMRLLDFQEGASEMEKALTKHGYRAAYHEWALTFERLDAHGVFVPPAFIAFVHGFTDEKDRAFAWLEEAYKVHDGNLTDLNSDPVWDPLRSDPRFTDLVKRVGLPDRAGKNYVMNE
jgi:TolB-like protein/DNA-binding winged helix-turn-helix (wHTH) protein/tetratricopeptide (TPR) repeat protein